jgi:hypothetical protein
MLIPASVLALWRVCAGESTRYAMTGVRFAREPDGMAVAAATDSKRLLVARWKEPTEVPEFTDPTDRRPDFAVMVPADSAGLLEEVGKTLRLEGRAWAALEESGDPGRFDLTLATLGTNKRHPAAAFNLTGRSVEGRFAPWQEVSAEMDAKAGKPNAECRLDPVLLRGLLEAAALASGDGDSFALGFAPAGKRVRFTHESNDHVVSLTGYMMPLD